MASFSQQHFLYFKQLPHKHGSFRPGVLSLFPPFMIFISLSSVSRFNLSRTSVLSAESQMNKLKAETTTMVGDVLAVHLRCLACGMPFTVCRSCYRGHRYCSTDCRDHGYERARRRARQRYARTTEAKADHRDRMRVYRKQKRMPVKPLQSVTDKSSDQRPIPLPLVSQCHVCIVCGRIHGLKVREISIEDMELQFFDSD